MKIFDVSVDIYNGMPAFPGDPPPEIKRVLRMPQDSFNVSLMCTGTHVGTHVDPPIHFVEGGYTVDKIPLDHLYGRAVVLEVPDADAVSEKDLKGVKADIILFKTKNSALWNSGEFHKDYVYLDESAARWLVDHKVKTVGIDYLSIGSFKSGEAVHKLLLGAGITVIEGLDFRKIEPGRYTLACLPLKIRDGDGAPARAFLIQE
ncbi:MAG TPA: cyclase family protein [Methanocella sp.]|uniref:cyclase family protein n=1 Tax=Methanocella sp. TaxID=2052833 RepID=UPI002C698712|nr:cyclase family protein [Methanocella sp.]HTY89896.1 cyclase family protein [Methanocella sp.]